MTGAGIGRADALHLPLRDESVDLIVTSPPYFSLRSYQDGGEHLAGQIGAEEAPQDFLEALWAVTAECVRVLKPTGSMFVNLGDKYAGSGGHNNSGLAPARTGAFGTRKHNGQAPRVIRPRRDTEPAVSVAASRRQAPDRYNQNSGGARAKSLLALPWRYAIGCVDRLDLILREDLVWDKPNGMPESVRDRARRSHEPWFHLAKNGRYFSATDAIREPYAPATAKRYALGYRERTHDAVRPTVNTKLGGDTYGQNPLGKLPGSVWRIPTEPLKVPAHLAQHFAAFPSEWPRRLILGFCPDDGVVLDPFGGTGTVAMVARALGRYGVSLDLSADYCDVARWRVFDSGHDRKVVARTNRARQTTIR